MERARPEEAAGIYRVGDFAVLAGVTVRALHHYDRVGLLKPRRTSAGYRMYTIGDLHVLEQIVALKFIGVPLKKIRGLLRKGAADLPRILAAQRAVIDVKRRLLDQTIRAISEAEAILRSGTGNAVNALKRVIEVIEMQGNEDQWKMEYDALLQGKIERLKSMSPDERSALQAEWATLLKDVEAALGEDPAGATAQALAARWMKLLEAFSSGPIDPALAKKFGAAYQNSGPGAAGFGDRRIWDFMGKAISLGASLPRR